MGSPTCCDAQRAISYHAVVGCNPGVEAAHETARVHNPARRRGGCMAARDARAAAGETALMGSGRTKGLSPHLRPPSVCTVTSHTAPPQATVANSKYRVMEDWLNNSPTATLGCCAALLEMPSSKQTLPATPFLARLPVPQAGEACRSRESVFQQARTNASSAAAGASKASGDCMAHKVAPLIAHQSSGTTRSSQCV